MDNVYAVKFFKDFGISYLLKNNLVTFSDHSAEVSAAPFQRRIPLPNRHYLAIHAAIAEIPHMSGARRFFNELLDEYRDEEGGIPSGSFSTSSFPYLPQITAIRCV